MVSPTALFDSYNTSCQLEHTAVLRRRDKKDTFGLVSDL